VHVWRLLDDGIRAEGTSRAVQPSEINVIAFAPDDATLATGAEDSTVAIWSLPKLELTREYTEHRSGVVSLGFCRTGDEARLYSSDRDGEVIARLSLRDQRHTRTLMQSFGRPRYLAVTPDCRRVVTSGATALAWNVESDYIRAQACQLGDSDEDGLAACDPRRARPK
jgi:WD40 repeat protein